MSLSTQSTWENALNILKEKLNQASYETWLKSTYLSHCSEKSATLVVQNDFAKEWLETRYRTLIQDTLHSILDRKVTLYFVTKDEIEKAPTTSEAKKGESDSSVIEPKSAISTKLNPKYTFDTFVIGNSNRLAHAACLAVAESPAQAYNPLFIYGGVGLGKTHLMHAIGTHIIEKKSYSSVVYVSSEKFTNELINSIRDDKTTEFRNKYRNIDVLLVDDIQFLAGKERTQEEFFHTFNALHEADKQLIISSDRPPKEIPTLEDRLRSRFEWGLITDIQPPDYETRLAILQKKAMTENIDVPDEVMSYIAEKIHNNIRKLEGALLRVAAYTSITTDTINKDFAAEVLKDIIPHNEPRPITIELIQEKITRHYQLNHKDLCSKKRNRSIAFPRQIAMFLCRELTDSSLPTIGENFGGRDHTTVIHAYEKISKEKSSNPTLREEIENLKNSIVNN